MSTDVAVPEAENAALIAAARGDEEFDISDFRLPLLKLGQGLTTEVAAGDAKAGDYINGLTAESYGTEIQFIVCKVSKGRFRADRKTGRNYVASTPIVPASWDPDPFVGKPFSEHPDAEEQYKARVNRKEIEWESGPPISTTTNFDGVVLPAEGDEEATPLPVRLSLMRTNNKAAQKINTTVRMALKAPWDAVFELGSATRDSRSGATSYVVTVRKGRKTTPEERSDASELAIVLTQNDVDVAGEHEDEEARPAQEPAAEGALDV